MLENALFCISSRFPTGQRDADSARAPRSGLLGRLPPHGAEARVLQRGQDRADMGTESQAQRAKMTRDEKNKKKIAAINDDADDGDRKGGKRRTQGALCLNHVIFCVLIWGGMYGA